MPRSQRQNANFSPFPLPLTLTYAVMIVGRVLVFWQTGPGYAMMGLGAALAVLLSPTFWHYKFFVSQGAALLGSLVCPIDFDRPTTVYVLLLHQLLSPLLLEDWERTTSPTADPPAEEPPPTGEGDATPAAAAPAAPGPAEAFDGDAPAAGDGGMEDSSGSGDSVGVTGSEGEATGGAELEVGTAGAGGAFVVTEGEGKVSA